MEQKKRRSFGRLVNRSSSEIYDILQDFEQQKGKMTTSEFCVSRGVASGSFYAWRKDEALHGKYSKSSKFVEIKPEGPALISSVESSSKIPVVPIFVSLRLGDFQLDIHGQVDAEYLRELLIG